MVLYSFLSMQNPWLFHILIINLKIWLNFDSVEAVILAPPGTAISYDTPES